MTMLIVSTRFPNGLTLELSMPPGELKRILVPLASRGKLPDPLAEFLILASSLEEE